MLFFIRRKRQLFSQSYVSSTPSPHPHCNNGQSPRELARRPRCRARQRRAANAKRSSTTSTSIESWWRVKHYSLFLSSHKLRWLTGPPIGQRASAASDQEPSSRTARTGKRHTGQRSGDGWGYRASRRGSCQGRVGYCWEHCTRLLPVVG